METVVISPSLARYREIIKTILTRYHVILSRKPKDGIERSLILDENRDHYMLMTVGWGANYERIYRTPIYVRLHNGKFWIEEDSTEQGIATDLLAAGVPHSDIVLAFYPLPMRQMSEFAVE